MISKQTKYDIMYMDIAETIAKMSYSTRSKVGCVIVLDNNIVSYGWNGMPSGFSNSCETDDVTNDEVVHSEANSIAKLARSNNTGYGATAYVTLTPCIQCAKLLLQTGIIRVVFRDAYRLTDGLELLKNSGIKVEHLNENTIK